MKNIILLWIVIFSFLSYGKGNNPSLEVHLNDVLKFNIFDHVVLEGGGNKKMKNIYSANYIEFKNLSYGKYKLIVITKFDDIITKEIVINKKRKYKLIISYSEVYKMVEDTENLSAQLNISDDSRYRIKIELNAGCTSSLWGNLYLYKTNDKISVFYGAHSNINRKEDILSRIKSADKSIISELIKFEDRLLGIKPDLNGMQIQGKCIIVHNQKIKVFHINWKEYFILEKLFTQK